MVDDEIGYFDSKDTFESDKRLKVIYLMIYLI
jgi:hypothetical protein